MPVKANSNCDLPNYRDILNNTFNKSKGEKKDDYKKIIDLIQIADEEYKNIEKLNLDKYILHGDLHHTNIILNNNQYKAIDPHGVIGEKILEVGCFILNELWIFNREKENIKNIIKKISKNMNLSEKEIARATFIQIVLSTAWSVEEKNWKIVDINNDICREILKI